MNYQFKALDNEILFDMLIQNRNQPRCATWLASWVGSFVKTKNAHTTMSTDGGCFCHEQKISGK